MRNLYIADMHLGSESCIEFDERPFKGVDEMEEAFIRNWNNAVNEDDTVYMLGDMFDDTRVDKVAEILRKLKGRKVMIRGNHEPIGEFPDKIKPLMEDTGSYLEITDGDREVVLSHYPILFHKNARHKKWCMVYGHLHNSIDYLDLVMFKAIIYVRAKRYDASIARLWYNCGAMMPWVDYTPRTLEELIEGENKARPELKKRFLKQLRRTLFGKRRELPWTVSTPPEDKEWIF